MKKSSRYIALALCLVLCFALFAGCNKTKDEGGAAAPPATDTSTPAAGAPSSTKVTDTSAPPPAGAKFAEHLTFTNDNNPIATLNPFNPASGTTPTYWTMRMILDSLILLVNGEFLPNLATSWETTDWKTFNIKLRDDAFFHNGEKFTAKDLEFTIVESRNGVGSQACDMWRPVETVNIINDYEVQLILNDVNVDFLFNMSMPSAGILNQKAYTEDAEKGYWIGTGAYKVVDFQTNNFVDLERNDNYWGKAPYTKYITLKFIPEMSTRSIMMQNKETHVAFGISEADIAGFEASPDFNVIPTTFNNPNTLGFGMLHPITSDWNFRMAVMHALNRPEIAVVAAGDWAAPEVTGTLWGYATQFRNNDIPLVEYNVEKAKEYLAKSPYNGEVLELATAIITNVKACEVIQQNLAAVGITVEVNEMDPPSLAAKAGYGKEDVELIMFVTGFNMSPSSFRNAYGPNGSYNRQTYDNPPLNEMIARVGTITDINEREKMYREMQEMVAADPPIVNVFWRLNGIVAQGNVGGLHLPPDVYYDLRYAYQLID